MGWIPPPPPPPPRTRIQPQQAELDRAVRNMPQSFSIRTPPVSVEVGANEPEWGPDVVHGWTPHLEDLDPDDDRPGSVGVDGGCVASPAMLTSATEYELRDRRRIRTEPRSGRTDSALAEAYHATVALLRRRRDGR